MNTPGFMLVMTGTPDLFPVLDDVFSPIVRQFKKINVGEFGKVNDTRACINKPLEKLGIDPKKIIDFETYRDVRDIHNLSGGRPYEIQLICHMLFRRLQLRRADTMKLDFSVLEEVRRELETWQDITSRPILTSVRNFSKKGLAALSILCSCNGRATFEQVWALEYIFDGESSWTKNTFKDVLQMNADKGILKIDNDLISFAGDDFDAIYAKYFAREQGIRLNFSRISLERRWYIALTEFLDLHLKDRLKPMLESIFISRSLYTIILKVVHKLEAQQPNGDVFVESELLSEELYKKMSESQGEIAIPVILVNPDLPWLNLQSLYCIMKPTDSKALEEGIDRVRSLGERITKLGGNLVVERKEVPIVPLTLLADKVEHTANERLRLRLSRFHMNNAKSAYLEDLDLEKASLHANLSYRYNPKPDGIGVSNDLGYIFLSADDFDKAEILFKRAISLSESTNSSEPVFPALPIYNLGVLRAKRGQLESAQDHFQSCISLAQNLNSEDRRMMCLWVSAVINDALEFAERMKPDLLETAESAKAAIERIMAHKSDG